MKLYIFAASPNCRKITALLNHLDMEVELIELNLTTGQHKSPEILGLNPNGSVPILEDEGFSLWESNAILQYLADKHGDTEVFPRDPKIRGEIIQWLYWQTAHFGAAISTIAWENFAKPIFGLGDADPVLVADGLARFHKHAAILESRLSDNDFIMGQNVTIADFSMANTATVNKPGKVPVDEYPAIMAWYERLDTLPAWQKSAVPLPA